MVADKKNKKSAKNTLKGKYTDQCMPALKEEFGYSNVWQIPRLQKVIINTCIKESVTDVKVLDAAVNEIGLIAGQRPVYTKAKKSISNFKLREGMKIGARVTLRGERMYDFLTRLLNVALPRVRDFKGLSPRAFDGNGNYTMGITEQTVFPEIDYDKVNRTNGMNITFVTSAKSDDEGRSLLKGLGMPFRK